MTFNNAYQLIRLPSLTSKPEKLHSEADLTPIVTYGEIEMMDHVLCECLHYSQLLWIHVGDIIQLYLASDSHDLSPRVELSQLNVIYNVPHPSPLLHIPGKLTRNVFIILTQEIKHDII